jgi:hypothetical protein
MTNARIEMNEQQKAAAQTAITAFLCVFVSIGLIFNIVMVVGSLLAFDMPLSLYHLLLPALSIFLLGMLMKDVRKGERLETTIAIFKKTLLPGLLASILCLGLWKIFFMFQIHDYELRVAYLKGQHDLIVEQNQKRLRDLKESYDLKDVYLPPNYVPTK